MGRAFGLAGDEMPTDIDAFERYMADMYASGDLYVSEAARELAIDIVMKPPVPAKYVALRELVNQITVGLLPSGLRRQYRFRWDPLRGAALAGSAEILRRLPVP